jgi:hypothetical protein
MADGGAGPDFSPAVLRAEGDLVTRRGPGSRGGASCAPAGPRRRARRPDRAISNSRLLSMDTAKVRFRYKIPYFTLLAIFRHGISGARRIQTHKPRGAGQSAFNPARPAGGSAPRTAKTKLEWIGSAPHRRFCTREPAASGSVQTQYALHGNVGFAGGLPDRAGHGTVVTSRSDDRQRDCLHPLRLFFGYGLLRYHRTEG